MVGNDLILENLWVRSLDMTGSSKFHGDACKMELMFTARKSDDGKLEMKISLEPIKLTFRRYDSGSRPQRSARAAELEEVFLLPKLTSALVSSQKLGEASETTAAEAADDDEVDIAFWSQVHGLTIPHELPVPRVSVNVREVDDDGIMHTSSSTLSLPRCILLSEVPSEKKMSRADSDRVLALMREDLVALGCPVGLQQSGQEAEASRARGECSGWTNSKTALGKEGSIWTTGRGVPTVVARVAKPVPTFAEGEEGEEEAPAKIKSVNTMWIDLPRVSAQLRAQADPKIATVRPKMFEAVQASHASSSASSSGPSAIVAAVIKEPIIAKAGAKVSQKRAAEDDNTNDENASSGAKVSKKPRTSSKPLAEISTNIIVTAAGEEKNDKTSPLADTVAPSTTVAAVEATMATILTHGALGKMKAADLKALCVSRGLIPMRTKGEMTAQLLSSV